MSKYVTPLEACTGAACAGCLQPGKDFKCCSKCKRAWYCGTECQKTHWTQLGHKQACASAATALQALTASIAAAEPTPSSYDEIQQFISATGHAVLHSSTPLHRDVFNMVSSTVFCRVCFRTRDQVPQEQRKHFRCCPTCLWGWCCCEQHWQQHKQQHAQHCSVYAAMSGSRLLSCKHLRQHAGEPLHFCPAGKMAQQQQHQLPSSWMEYIGVRQLPDCQPHAWLCMTEGLSIPLTAALACSHLCSNSQLQSMQEFTLHLVGSSQYEFQQVISTPVIEEIMHLLPAVKKLHVVMVGPDLVRIMATPNKYVPPMDKGTCPPCEAAGCKRLYSFYRGCYEEFAASSHWTSPSLALACNSGIGEEETAPWLKAVSVLLDKGVPCCFTSMQETEGAEDAAVLAAAGARIVHGPAPNPFRSLAPLLDSSMGPDRFYCLNAVMTCFKGRVESNSSSSSGSGSKSKEAAVGKDAWQ